MSKTLVRPFPERSGLLFPPKALVEAERRIAQRIEDQMALVRIVPANDLHWEGSEVPLTPSEVREWRKGANRGLFASLREIQALWFWIKAARGLVPTDGPPDLPRRPHPAHFRDELEACCEGGLANEIICGSWIALATGDRDRTDGLFETWNRAVASSAVDRDQLNAVFPILVGALASSGRATAAFTLLQHRTDEAAAYGWLAYGAARDDPSAFRRVLALAEAALDPSQLIVFLLRLHAQAPERALLERAEALALSLPAPVPRKEERGQERLLLSIFHAWLRLGDVARARQLLPRFTPLASFRPQALAALYRHTGATFDLAWAQEVFAVAALSVGSVCTLSQALAHHNEWALVRWTVGTWPDPALRCAGAAAVALVAEGGRRETFLGLAEAAYEATDLLGGSTASLAFEELARAQIAAGHVGAAFCVLSLIRDRLTRCRLLLILRAQLEGEPVPAFLREWYERL